MKKRYSHRWGVERSGPIRRWVVLGALLLLPATFLLAESPPREVEGPTGEWTAVVMPAGVPNGDCNAPGNQVMNCGFETGDFTGWTTEDVTTPFFPLQVGGNGTNVNNLCNPTCGLFVASDPPQGISAAFHGWDGDAGTIRIHQELTVPGFDPFLQFDFRVGFDLLNFGNAAQDRDFIVTIEPAGGGTPILTRFIFTAPAGTVDPDNGDRSIRLPLDSVAGQDVRLVFSWEVPEPATGPGFFQLDNIGVFSTCGNGVVDAGCDCCSLAGMGTPGCNNEGCEVIVCDVDPFCCNTEWDNLCDGQGLSLCSCCAGETCDDGNVTGATGVGGGQDCCSGRCRLSGDANGSDRTDGFDLSVVAQAFGLTGPPEADLNSDGIVDGVDVDQLTQAFGCELAPVP